MLQISNYYYPNRGGIEQVSRDIANALRGKAFEQQIICFNENARDKNISTYRRETIEDEVDGIPVIRCGCIVKIRSQSISLTYHQKLKELLQSFRPDIIIFHYPNPFVAHFLLKMIPRQTKLVLYWHLDIVKQKLLRMLFTKQNNHLLQRANLIVATSPNYIEGSCWLKKTKEKCVVVPNSISEERLIVTPEAMAIANRIRQEHPQKIICAAVGRNVQYKGLSYLVQASKLLDDQYVVYIAGKDTEKLKPEVQDDKKVCLFGAVDDNTLKGLLLAADIFCFPSATKNEAFGIALAEAMYYKKPAVTFTIVGSGVNYVCPNKECGLEVSNGNIPEFANAIQTLGNNPQLRESLGQQGKNRVVKLFTSKQFNDNIIHIMNTLMCE